MNSVAVFCTFLLEVQWQWHSKVTDKGHSANPNNTIYPKSQKGGFISFWNKYKTDKNSKTEYPGRYWKSRDRFCSCPLRMQWALKLSAVSQACSWISPSRLGWVKSWQHTLPWTPSGLSSCIISMKSQRHQCHLQDLSDRIQKPNYVSRLFSGKIKCVFCSFLSPCSVRPGLFVLFSSSCYMKHRI